MVYMVKQGHRSYDREMNEKLVAKELKGAIYIYHVHRLKASNTLKDCRRVKKKKHALKSLHGSLDQPKSTCKTLFREIFELYT
jgi:flagellin-specific chaperone FliS